jgi:hypothetical protein
LHFRPEAIERLGASTVIFDSEINDINGVAWLRITDSWFDLETSHTSDVEFRPHAKQFVAKHNDQSELGLRYRKYKIPALETWLRSIVSPSPNHGITKPQLAKEYVKEIIERGAVDSDENVPIMEIFGRFRTPEAKVVIRRNKCTVDFAAAIIGRPHRMNLTSILMTGPAGVRLRFDPSRHGGREIFGMG